MDLQVGVHIPSTLEHYPSFSIRPTFLACSLFLSLAFNPQPTSLTSLLSIYRLAELE
jgi:hypothetical protein